MAKFGTWKPIETAPRKSEWISDGHGYGRYILAYPVFGEVARVHWWQSQYDPKVCNFLEDGGNAVHPTHWMPLPDPPDSLS